jgi:hypothetical protein
MLPSDLASAVDVDEYDLRVLISLGTHRSNRFGKLVAPGRPNDHGHKRIAPAVFALSVQSDLRRRQRRQPPL